MLELLPDTGLGQGLTIALVVVDILLRIAAVMVVPYNRRPPAAMAWLLLIMVQPILGWIIFATLGHNRLPRGRRRKMLALQGVIGEVTREIPDEVASRILPLEGDPAALRAEGVEIATELCDDLLAGGAPGLHFYTLNRSKATREIFAGLGSRV